MLIVELDNITFIIYIKGIHIQVKIVGPSDTISTVSDVCKLDMSYILIGCFIFAILYYAFTKRRIKGRSIPGPRGLPLIGSFLDIDSKYMHLAFDKWARVFGDVYGAHILGNNLLILNSSDAIRAACLTDPEATLLADRPPQFGFKLVFNNQFDIVMGRSGEEQRKLRKIGHRLLKSYGEGILRIQQIATRELEKVTQAFRETKGASMDPSAHVYLTICNTITTLVSGSFRLWKFTREYIVYCHRRI